MNVDARFDAVVTFIAVPGVRSSLREQIWPSTAITGIRDTTIQGSVIKIIGRPMFAYAIAGKLKVKRMLIAAVFPIDRGGRANIINISFAKFDDYAINIKRPLKGAQINDLHIIIAPERGRPNP